MRVSQTIVVLGLLCAVQSSATASLVLLHNNGGPDYPGAIISDPTYPNEIGDDFQVSTPAKITRVSWYGAYHGGDSLPNGPDHFSIRFFEFSGPNTPNTVPLHNLVLPTVERTQTSLTLIGNNPVYHYQADFPDIGLLTGRYLMSIVNDTTGMPERWGWHLHSQASGSRLWTRNTSSQSWLAGGSEMSFQIWAVPEPGVVSGVAVFGVMLLRRRRGRTRGCVAA